MGISQNDRAAWLEARKAFITASDVGALMSVSPYKTRDVLKLEKAGLGDEFEGNELTELALDLEPFVAEQARKRWGWNLTPHGELTVDPRCPYLAATPDFIGDGPFARFNCQVKVTMVKPYEQVKKYGNAPPLHYLYQVQAELACLGLDYGCLLVLHTAPLCLRSYPIRANHVLQQRIRVEATKLMAEVAAIKEGRVSL